eukprot:CAMPEP_0185379890 /NCGR_PEP_ID=MMETSP1364-20130426/48807_1 /TAXON_ID=38817 /ORGANISM="Gephyrocapsa oceanica, Strain RCC1303" /LENGTH=33 /DNA_ID= /DNA_START= /DNA_END= /DNA_ORIENTATION=
MIFTFEPMGQRHAARAPHLADLITMSAEAAQHL